MRFTNAAQAAAAYDEQSRRLGLLLSEADDGNGGLDIMQITGLTGDAPARQGELDRLFAELQAVGEERAQLARNDAMRTTVLGAQEASRSPNGRPGMPRGTGKAKQSRTVGEFVAEHAAWRDYLGTIATPDGHIRDKTPINSPRIMLPGSLLQRAVRNEVLVLSDPESAGAMVVPQDSGIVVPYPVAPTTVLDIITIGSTDNDAVQYVRVTGETGAAAGVGESTTVEDPDPLTSASGYKPELGLQMERVTATVESIAGWIPASTRSLSDAGQLRTLIDRFLRSAVQREAERQVIDGTGTGEEIEGIDVAHTLDQPYSATVAGLNPLLETTRKALTQIQTSSMVVPNAYVLHPLDWEKIELARMEKNPANEGAGPGLRFLHGVPVVLNNRVTAGEGWVGDFRWYVLWMREQFSVQASNAPGNFFLRNLVALLGEERAAGGLLLTNAVCKIDLTLA